MEDHSVVTKAELKNIQLIAKLEDNVQALTDAKKQADNENAKLTEQNDQLKKETIKLTETNKALTLQVSDLEQEHQKTKTEYDKRMSALETELNELFLKKQGVETELKAANEKISELNDLNLQKQNVETELKHAIEKIATIEAEQIKDKELLSLLCKPNITKEDLTGRGATIDTWNGDATFNNLVFKKEFAKDSYRLFSLT